MAKNVKKHGKSSQNKQRFKCLKCNKTFVWQRKDNKHYREQHWFKLWVTEGFSVRQLSYISGHSKSKLKQIKNYWLNQEPPALSQRLISQAKYILFDGTYFHKNGCMVVFVDSVNKNHIHYAYIKKEGYYTVYPLLEYLREQGLNPAVFTLDGHAQVINAIRTVWPDITIQRCLFHIKNQGLMWIRYRPKTEAACQLKTMLYGITNIKTVEDRDSLVHRFQLWTEQYKDFIAQLPKDSVANKDLKKTASLIRNALPNMFHYIEDRNIAPTTNYLESYFSQLKHHYRCHRGLTEQHKIQYLKWYCFFKNSNTF